MNIIKSLSTLLSYSSIDIKEHQILEKCIEDIEDIAKKHHHIHKDKEYKDSSQFNGLLESIAEEFKNNIETFKTTSNIDKFKKNIQKKYKYTISNAQFIKIYKHLNLENQQLRNLITKKKCKSNSGVLVITVLTSAHPEYIDEESGEVKRAKFSCKHDCAYCPNEPAHEGNNWVAQPRSYLYSEPAVLRANANDFDPIKQMNSRISSLINMGHIPDKLEIIVLGGTWSEYPRNYQDRFITELYYSANVYFDSDTKRPKLSLEEEIEINETAKIHIIGLTLETRPDTITIEEIANFRRYNCTRIQLGVQHTNNAILRKIMRGHTIERAYEAIKLLKNNCYKVDIHIMPNLPGASCEIDKVMLEEILYDERIQVDQYKIYPTAIVPFTRIKRWFDEGSYVPYDDLLLYELIKEFKKKVQKYKRLNRIIRDIPGHYIEGGYSTKFVNMRQLLQDDMRLNKWGCECIRCREIKGNIVSPDNIRLNIEKYRASGGDEYHISFDTICDKNYLIGFLRLRLSPKDAEVNAVLPSIKGCALIRELHVYSNISDVGNNIEGSLQHKGYGKQLVAKAEEIAKENGYNKVAIISGTGVRGYYKKLGYQLVDTYMIKGID
uniref:tRNA carboxymethyluridine synthase n=1 Tax=viral metagenome TaxID=1070528 RepID=A0A6C0L9W7_9ZZZZ